MKFRPGQSGNPGGRPKVVGELQELARRYTPEVIEELARLALKAEVGNGPNCSVEGNCSIGVPVGRGRVWKSLLSPTILYRRFSTISTNGCGRRERD